MVCDKKEGINVWMVLLEGLVCKCRWSNEWLHADKDVDPVDHDHVEKELLQKFNLTSNTTNKMWPLLSLTTLQLDTHDTRAAPDDLKNDEAGASEQPHNKNIPSLDKDDSNIPRYIGADDIVAHRPVGNLSSFVHGVNPVTDPCSGFEELLESAKKL